MNVLYKGRYKNRFNSVCNLISGQKVTELCFGDLVIANFCKHNNISWTGIDINQSFIDLANKNNFNTILQNVNLISEFPKADTCIICGSLYHFNFDLESLFSKMLASASRIIISEPVVNLSNRNDLIGKIARSSATVNGIKNEFRFTEDTLNAALKQLSKKLNFRFQLIEKQKKDIVIFIER